MPRRRPIIIGIGGFASNSGKTTLLCKLLQAFPGWEAIKTTRGHYRSCGKDPQTCCVSHLLGDEPVVRSGRVETYTPGKDTGRYWDAGASNVHWVIATAEQVAEGINRALVRVESSGVLIEGNSFSESVQVDLMVMVAPAAGQKIKSSARRALAKSSLLFLAGEATRDDQVRFKKWLAGPGLAAGSGDLPIYTQHDLSELIKQVRRVDSFSAV